MNVCPQIKLIKIASCLMALTGASFANGQSFQTLIRGGEAVPGGFVIANSLSGGRFDENGTLWFDAVVHAGDPSVPNGGGLFAIQQSGIARKAYGVDRSSDGGFSRTPLPGNSSGVVLDSPFQSRYVLGGGGFGMVSILTGPGVNGFNDLAIVIESGGELVSPARLGDAVPGLAGSVYTGLRGLRLNPSGQYLFAARTNFFSPDQLRDGLWRGDARSAGSLERIFIPGDATPLGPQTRFTELDGNAALSENGDAVFRGRYLEGNLQKTALFRYSSTAQEVLIRTGDAIAGAPGNTVADGIGAFALSPDGDVVYSAVSTGSRPVLYRRDAGSTTPRTIVSAGLPIAGEQVIFDQINSVATNSRGSTLFNARATIPVSGWWMERDGQISRVLTAGFDTSGAVPQVRGVRGLTNLNESDQFAGVFGLSMPIREGDVLIAYDPASGPYELLRTGDLFDFGNGLVLPIAEIRLFGGDVAGDGASLTESGQFAFWVTSVSGDPGPASAIVQFTIPSPGTAVAFLMGGALAWRRRRR